MVCNISQHLLKNTIISKLLLLFFSFGLHIQCLTFENRIQKKHAEGTEIFLCVGMVKKYSDCRSLFCNITVRHCNSAFDKF